MPAVCTGGASIPPVHPTRTAIEIAVMPFRPAGPAAVMRAVIPVAVIVMGATMVVAPVMFVPVAAAMVEAMMAPVVTPVEPFVAAVVPVLVQAVARPLMGVVIVIRVMAPGRVALVLVAIVLGDGAADDGKPDDPGQSAGGVIGICAGLGRAGTQSAQGQDGCQHGRCDGAVHVRVLSVLRPVRGGRRIPVACAASMGKRWGGWRKIGNIGPVLSDNIAEMPL